MSQCVPRWEFEDPPNSSYGLQTDPSSSAAATVDATANLDAAPVVIGSKPDEEVAELTWVNGHPSMHGLGQFRMSKPVPKYPLSPASWDRVLSGGGTLESVVDQATGAILLPSSPCPTNPADYGLVPLDHHNEQRGCSSTATAVPVDALVPCSNQPQVLADDNSTRVPEPPAGVSGVGRKRSRDGNCEVFVGAAACENSGAGEDVAFAASNCLLDVSPNTEYASCGRALTAVEEHDPAGQSCRLLKDEGCVPDEKKTGVEATRSSISTKRSRAAAVHNQSERRRRNRINQRLKTLQKLVPNCNKMDTASMLDEVIEYLKQIQAQVQTMNRLGTIPHMMMPMPFSVQQLQMAMMAQTAQMAQMGMGMHGNPLIRFPAPSSALPAQPTLQTPAYFPFAGPPWDASGDQGQPPLGPMGLQINPFSTFMACQAQKPPMNLDDFNKMAGVYQQAFQHPPAPSSTDPNGKSGR